MIKQMFLFAVAVAALLALTACGGNDTNEPTATEQITAVEQDSQSNEQSSQEPQDNQTGSVDESEEEGDSAEFATRPIDPNDPLFRLRSDAAFGWLAYQIEEWSETLGMSIDEIFDYVRAATTLDYAFDYGIEGGMDVGELAARVGETSVSFMSLIHTAYDSTRSFDTVERWAGELNMTVYEMVNAFNNDVLQDMADTLGVEVVEFQTVLAGVAIFVFN